MVCAVCHVVGGSTARVSALRRLVALLLLVPCRVKPLQDFMEGETFASSWRVNTFARFVSKRCAFTRPVLLSTARSRGCVRGDILSHS